MPRTVFIINKPCLNILLSESSTDRIRAGGCIARSDTYFFCRAVALAVMVIAVVNVTADAVVYILLVNMTAAVVVFIFHFNVLSFLKITIIFYPAYGVTYKKNLALEDEFCLYM